jgi:hypothetical protein
LPSIWAFAARVAKSSEAAVDGSAVTFVGGCGGVASAAASFVVAVLGLGAGGVGVAAGEPGVGKALDVGSVGVVIVVAGFVTSVGALVAGVVAAGAGALVAGVVGSGAGARAAGGVGSAAVSPLGIGGCGCGGGCVAAGGA